MQTKQGLIEVAEGGTLFIDEIAEMGPGLQAKLLRALENGEFRRVGGVQELRADVRLIAATNKNLEEEQKANRFREDLYYRLNVLRLEAPPLRARLSAQRGAGGDVARSIRAGAVVAVELQRAAVDAACHLW